MVENEKNSLTFQQIFLRRMNLLMEGGDVDRTVIDCWQHQLSQMADFPPLLTISVFDL